MPSIATAATPAVERFESRADQEETILWTIIIGLVAGALAKLLVPGRDGGGILTTIILGIAGALIATFVGKAVGWYEPGQSAGFIGATIGAILVLIVYHLFRRSAARVA